MTVASHAPSVHRVSMVEVGSDIDEDILASDAGAVPWGVSRSKSAAGQGDPSRAPDSGELAGSSFRGAAPKKRRKAYAAA